MFRFKSSAKTDSKEILKFHLKHFLFALLGHSFVVVSVYLHSFTLTGPISQRCVNALRIVGIFGILLQQYSSMKRFLQPSVNLAVMPLYLRNTVTFIYICYDTLLLLYFDQIHGFYKLVVLFLIGIKYLGVIPMESVHSGYKRPKCVILGGREHGLIPGCGVCLKRDISSLQIKLINLNYNILSNKAFFKRKTRKIGQDTFTHWLPLNLGNPKKKSKQLELLKRALNFMKYESAAYDQSTIQDTIIELFPKLVSSTLYDITSTFPNYYNSNALNCFFYLLATFHLLQEECPSLQTLLIKRIQLFMADESNRTKQALPALGDILAVFLLCQGISFKSGKGRQFMDIFLKEQSDRHVLWILQKYPHFGKFRTDQDHLRIDDTFNQKKSSFNFVMGAYCLESTLLTINGVKAPFALSNLAITSHKANTYAILTSQFHTQIDKIYQFNSYKEFYRYLGKEPPSRPQYLQFLKQSVTRSLAKGYHSTDDQSLSLPEEVKPHQTKFNSLFQQLKIVVTEGPQIDELLNSLSFQKQADIIHNNYGRELMLWLQILNLNEDKIQNVRLDSLQIDLILTSFLRLFQHFPNFTLFYHFVEVAGSRSTHLTLPLLSTSELKSGCYWVMKAVQNHKQLQSLKIKSLQSCTTQTLSSGFLKYLSKGLHNISELKVTLLILQNLEIQKSQEFKQVLTSLVQSLEKLHFNSIKIDEASQIALIKCLAKMTNLNSLCMDHAQLSSGNLINLSDAALSLKKLSYLKISSNLFTGQSISLFLKNMAFLANLEDLQLSFIQIENSVPEVQENMAKLVSFSRSLRSLNLTESGLVGLVSTDFYNALGHSTSLQALYLDHSSVVLNAVYLGRAIAINSIHKNPLRFVSLKKGVLGDISNYEAFISSLFWRDSQIEAISHQDYNICGKVVDPDGTEAVLRCGLRELVIQGRQFQEYKFKQKAENALKRAQFYAHFVSLKLQNLSFQDQQALFTEQLECLSLRHNGLKVSTLFPRSLKILDLSGNNISDLGIKALLPFIQNSDLQDLNLYQNNLTIESAKYLESALKERARLHQHKSSTLRRLDIGYNRLRDKGSFILLHALLCSGVRVISLRSNFITTKGCLQLLEISELRAHREISLALMQNKIQNTPQLKQKLAQLQSENPQLRVDLALSFKESLYTAQTILVTGFPLTTKQIEIAQAFKQSGCPGVVSLRIRVHKSQKGVKTGLAFVEMRDKHLAKQALHQASSQRLLLNGKRLKAHKAKESI